MKNFWKPLQGEFKWNPNGILGVIGALGIIPAIFVGRYTDSFWCSVVFLLYGMPSSILRFLPIVISRTSEILQSAMKKRIIYFISFLLVCCVSGYFLGKLNNMVYTLLYFLLVLAGAYLLYKAFPINYKKENDNDE